MIQLIFLFIFAYIAGSINFSILVFTLLGKEDPRKMFSKNPGVTNVYRRAGFFLASIVLILDIARAAGVALISGYLLPMDFIPWIGLGLIIGNRFPCFHNFKGGKGVANYLGFTFIITPVSTGISALAWCAVYGLFKTPFVASFVMVSVLAAGTIMSCDYNPIPLAGTSATVLFIFCNHRSNVSEFIQNKHKII